MAKGELTRLRCMRIADVINDTPGPELTAISKPEQNLIEIQAGDFMITLRPISIGPVKP